MSFNRVFAFAVLFLCGCVSSPPDVGSVVPTKQIALTYDDAPLGQGPRYSGPQRTKALIRQLARSRSGPVAIFVTTKGLDQADGASRIASYAAAGHLIANHSDQHMWASRTPTQDYIADIDHAERRLAGFNNRRPWFRFPYLDEGGMDVSNDASEKRDALRAALAERDLISGYVTVDTFDWHLDHLWGKAVEAGQSVDMDALSAVYVDLVLDAAEHYDRLSQDVLGRQPVQVLLLHENDLAASFTSDLIRALRAAGWQIVDPDTAFADPIATQIPETRFSGMGRVAALAAEAGNSDRGTLAHWSVNASAIEDRVRSQSVFGAVSGTGK